MNQEGHLDVAPPCRPCWQNCAVRADAEMQAIDRMEDALAPLDPKITKVRGLITGLELCHHKAERWVVSIIEAIGRGETTKGLGTRSSRDEHPAERVWQSACAALSAWCAGCPTESIDLSVSGIRASELLGGLGERSPLKEWQVQRVIEKIRSSIHWPRPLEDPSARYVWLLLEVGPYEYGYLTDCPEQYREHEELWQATVRSMIRDTVDGHEARLSLGLAIDMLWPCHWDFVENLRIVLAAIGGDLRPARPFAACGRNICRTPIRRRMEAVTETLRFFCGERASESRVDDGLLARLGKASDERRWLAASLHKTIRLQLDPPSEMRALSAMTGPEWLQERSG
jgi:hypothetical protein